LRCSGLYIDARTHSYPWSWGRKVAWSSGKMPRLHEINSKYLRGRGTLRWVGLSTGLAVLLLATIPVSASKKMRPLTHEEVAQVWVGISEDEQYLFRLSLANDGSGTGAYIFVDESPHSFRISNWKYEPPSIRISLEPVDHSPLVAKVLTGTIVGVRMSLRMSGRDWSRSLAFRREEVLLSRWSRAKDAMVGGTTSPNHGHRERSARHPTSGCSRLLKIER
jgi:hypothetical protein